MALATGIASESDGPTSRTPGWTLPRFNLKFPTRPGASERPSDSPIPDLPKIGPKSESGESARAFLIDPDHNSDSRLAGRGGAGRGGAGRAQA